MIFKKIWQTSDVQTCVLDFGESFPPSGEADAATSPTCGISRMSNVKDPQDARLVDIFERLFQAPGAAGGRSSQQAVFMPLKPPGSCFTITDPDSFVRREEV